jgi:hypothetical protein
MCFSVWHCILSRYWVCCYNQRLVKSTRLSHLLYQIRQIYNPLVSKNCNSIRWARNAARNLDKIKLTQIPNFSEFLLTFKGTLLKKNEYLFSFLHSSANRSKSNNSPIGNPHPASSHSCIQCVVLWNGIASKAGMSPTTAENFFSQIQRSSSSAARTPIAGGGFLVSTSVLE